MALGIVRHERAVIRKGIITVGRVVGKHNDGDSLIGVDDGAVVLIPLAVARV